MEIVDTTFTNLKESDRHKTTTLKMQIIFRARALTIKSPRGILTFVSIISQLLAFLRSIYKASYVNINGYIIQEIAP